MHRARRLQPFGESVFTELTRRAREMSALNLAQGFPDFPGPLAFVRSQVQALNESSNQYAPSFGIPELHDALRIYTAEILGLERKVAQSAQLVTAGATAGVFCVVLGCVNPGDRVLCFEPFYESYRMAVEAAGGVFVAVPLRLPDEDLGLGWSIDWEAFEAAASLPFRGIILNSPHNPTGLCLDPEDFERILGTCRSRGAFAVCDEVYEHLVYEGQEHVSIFHSADPARDPVVRVSSVAKAFGFTGFKLGWIQGNPQLVDAAHFVSQAYMFCVPTAIQYGLVRYLDDRDSQDPDDCWRLFLTKQKLDFESRRNRLISALTNHGFFVGSPPAGSYFVCATAQQANWAGASDRGIVDRILDRCRVAALPLTSLCLPFDGSLGARNHPLHRFAWLRFAFCKGDSALKSLEERLSRKENSCMPGS